ncbi:MAG: hypothetical protein M9925_16995, partial [Chloroflexi bacterium]|nr:hypothetical protein [Chloroflexota bacterium]
MASLPVGSAQTWKGSITGAFSSQSGAWTFGPPATCTDAGLSYTPANTIIGTSGPDVLTLGNQGQLVLALGGDDIVSGGNGKDCIDGGDGNDLLKGDNGKDVILGGNGDDVLVGGNGKDVLDG